MNLVENIDEDETQNKWQKVAILIIFHITTHVNNDIII